MIKRWKVIEPEQSLPDAEASEFEKSSATFSPADFRKLKLLSATPLAPPLSPHSSPYTTCSPLPDSLASVPPALPVL
jgi:hypothetical protein